ncbi:hypothetical protein EG68_01893 [Paragonimus skrjabini miyazakii]|uniref:Apple domain-containing protein n=1 Tax=Paragonimus skrjabini miyazakii TaxID=59628 RepID=A0A8S9Z0D9_9TREM|nr:hypothetical protein EG68_01893 [Paragonimus skrjabini miyazakii]
MMQRLWIVFGFLTSFIHVVPCGVKDVGCPYGLTSLDSNFCVINLEDTNTFCGAAESCASHGKLQGWKLFLIGRNAPLLDQNYPFTLHPIWTGVNQLLINRQTASDGWRDTNPDTPEYTTPLNFPWFNNQPTADKPCTYYDFNNKRYVGISASSSDEYSVFCEFGGLLPVAPITIKFSTEFPQCISDVFQINPEFIGCYSSRIIQTTRMKCAFMCAANHACRSVYFEKQTGQCIQVLYADSLLAEYHRNEGNNWVRFAKTTAALEP